MATYTVKVVNKLIINTGLILIIPISLLIPLFLLFLKVNWVLYILSAILIGFFLFNLLEKKSMSFLKIILLKNSLQIFNYKNDKEVLFECNLDEVKIFKIKYINRNFPSFKILTLSGEKFKFNCKDKGDNDYHKFIEHFKKLTKNINH